MAANTAKWSAVGALVRALRRCSDDLEGPLCPCVQTIVNEAASTSWQAAGTQHAQALANLDAAGPEPEQFKAAVAEFSTAVPNAPKADSRSALLSQLIAAGRAGVKNGEAADPAAHRFWSTCFFTTTKAVPFTTFIDKFFRSLSESGADAAWLERMEKACKLRRLVFDPLRHTIVGNASEVAPVQLQDVIDESASYKFPDAVVGLIESLAASVPPLDRELADLVSDAGINDTARARLVLQDAKCELRELAKLSTTRLDAYLQTLGMFPEDAERLAFRIFQTSRQFRPLVVRSKTNLDLAQDAIEARDAVVDMSNCQLNPETAHELIDATIRTQAATSVDLASNNLHADGAKLVVKLITGLPTLRAVSVVGNNIQLSGMTSVLEAVVGTRLRVLDLSCCHGGNECAAVIQRLLPQTRIQRFSAGGNDITPAAAGALAGAVASSSRLRSLNVAGNELRDAGIETLMRDGVAKHRLLTSLDIGDNKFSDACIRTIASVIAGHESLAVVKLSRNHNVTAESIDALRQAMRDNKMIESIEAEHCGLDDANLTSLLEQAENNAALRKTQLDRVRDTPAARWNVDDVSKWLRLKHRRPDIADELKKAGITGSKLVALTFRGMQRNGIADVDDREFLMNAISELTH